MFVVQEAVEKRISKLIRCFWLSAATETVHDSSTCYGGQLIKDKDVAL